MADHIQSTLDTRPVELISGSRGEFSIWVGDTCVAQKTATGYPAADTVLAAVREHLA